MPWVNEGGALRSRSALVPPTDLTPEQVASLNSRGWEWVEPITGPAASMTTAPAQDARRREYARRWRVARADSTLRREAARVIANPPPPRPAGYWVNSTGTRRTEPGSTTHPDELPEQDRDARLAAGYRWCNAETYGHPTLRGAFLRTFNQDGEQEAARDRLAQRLTEIVPPQEDATAEMWVERQGGEYRGSVTAPEVLQAGGYLRVTVNVPHTAATRADAWLNAELRRRFAGGMDALRGYVWLMRDGFPHPEVRADFTADRRREIEDEGYRRIHIDLSRGPVTRAQVHEAWALAQRTTTTRAPAPPRAEQAVQEGAWVNRDGDIHPVVVNDPEHVSPAGLLAPLREAGWRWVGGPNARSSDRATRAAMWTEAVRLDSSGSEIRQFVEGLQQRLNVISANVHNAGEGERPTLELTYLATGQRVTEIRRIPVRVGSHRDWESWPLVRQVRVGPDGVRQETRTLDEPVVAGTQPAAPAPAPALQRHQVAWLTTQQALIEALTALPPGLDGGDEVRGRIAGELGHLIHRCTL